MSESPSPAQHAGYLPSRPLTLPDRTWPNRTLSAAPRWLSTDLRDGNQSLIEPMDASRKLKLLRLLLDVGYREIEVGFPTSSRADHEFVRRLVREDLVPPDVTVTVMTPAREDLIHETVRSVVGLPRVVLHLYNATAPVFRDVVYGLDRDGCRNLAVHGTRLLMKYAEELLPGVDVRLQYSPEAFTDTEPDFALEVCEAVMDVWEPGPGRPVILNLPATVERTTPNVFADQIEWFGRHVSRREHVCLSIHPHNDRGTAVAATELALLAGADRVEGCLFGNGERTGNVCLVTLALNLLSQGVDPGVDFSDLAAVRRVVEECNQLPVHHRHPYAGDFVHTAFSGAHQDAISKGLARQRGDEPWRVPYLPIDPATVGASYTGVIRINSQSGKGGAAYLMRTEFGFDLPRRLQIEFAALVQRQADSTSGEVSSEELWRIFAAAYLDPPGPDAAALLPAEVLEEVVQERPGGPCVYAYCRVGERRLWGVGLGADRAAARARAALVSSRRAAAPSSAF
jgi:2-isopropylmalate synthase